MHKSIRIKTEIWNETIKSKYLVTTRTALILTIKMTVTIKQWRNIKIWNVKRFLHANSENPSLGFQSNWRKNTSSRKWTFSGVYDHGWWDLGAWHYLTDKGCFHDLEIPSSLTLKIPNLVVSKEINGNYFLSCKRSYYLWNSYCMVRKL